MAKNTDVSNFWHIFRPFTGYKTSPNYFFLVEELLSFNLVGYVKIGQELASEMDFFIR